MSNYGLTENTDVDHNINSVVDCLGGGKYARCLLREIANAETGMGTIKDRTVGCGMGIVQFDEIGFDDVKDRTRRKHKTLIQKYFDININNVEWEDLRYSPLLGFLFCRLKFKLIPDAIPHSMEGRAAYWKKFYNTEAGKGTIKHYMVMQRGDDLKQREKMAHKIIVNLEADKAKIDQLIKQILSSLEK
jgi:hypothetical protein